jgi:ferrochelatase
VTDTGPGRVGLVVMAYGTPRRPEDVEEYYTHIRRGRPPTPELLAELQGRYDAIGGISPLAQRTEDQRAALAAALEARAPGRFEVVLGQKHAAPFIEDAVGDLAGAGITLAVGLVLAPHYSGASVGQYQERAAATGAEVGVEVLAIDSWHLEAAYLDFLSSALTEARADVPADHKILFTAHSLPERALVDDPYPDQLRESATAVAERVGLSPWADWSIAWQSAGRTPEPWRGPDILEVIRDLAATGRSDGVVVCAQGFVADHLEVLYDLDIEARRVAEDQGLAFARTRSLNAEPAVMAALADRVLARVAEHDDGPT